MQDLEAVLAYIAADAPVAAHRFGQKLLARVALLADHPLSGGFVAEDDSRRYRQVVQGAYRILYRFERGTVHVVAVHHGARLLDTSDLDEG